MIFKRKKSQIYKTVAIAFGFSLIYILYQLDQETYRLYRGLPYLFLGLWYIAQSLYQLRTPLLDLTENTINYFVFPRTKSIYLSELGSVEYTVGDYSFKTTSGKVIRISKSQFREEDVAAFEEAYNDIKSKKELFSLKPASL